MAALKRFFYLLGQTVDPFRSLHSGFDPELYLPKEWKGKTIEQRAAMTIAAGFQEGIRQVKLRHPELLHVEETPTARTSRQ